MAGSTRIPTTDNYEELQRMKRVLIVKVTSLGDIVHAQPVVADLHRAFPGVKVDWAADEVFAEIVQWNRGVDRVLCAPLRRFKHARNWSDLTSIASSIAQLRAERYDAIVDIHGVYKSAIISFLARSSRRLGYQSQDLGERGAAFAYNGRFGPRPDCDAWHGMRVSVSEALGYPLDGEPMYNLSVPSGPEPVADHPAEASPVAMLFHATSKDDKKWPAAHWVVVGRELTRRGLRVALPWGSDAERAEATAISAQVPGSTVLPRMTVTELARAIEASALVVGTDTGFVHLAHALQKPVVMIFVATSPQHCGVSAPFRSISIGDGQHIPATDTALKAIDHVYENARAPVRGDTVTPFASA
jgi:heptosyltransferase-1